MNLRVGRPYLYLLLVTLLLGGLLFFTQESSLFALSGVKYNEGAPIVDTLVFVDAYGTNLFDLKFDRYADSIMDNRKVLRVDFDYAIPNKVKITINDIDPIAVALAEGKLYGINAKGYVIPHIPEGRGINLPVISGVDNLKLYDAIRDDELLLVMDNLKEIMEEDREVFMSLANIIMTDTGCVSLFIEGVKPEIVTYPGELAQKVRIVEAFLHDYAPDLSGVKYLDLRSEGLIVAVND